ncbi:MAG: DUF2339 domain-containing protein [Chlorobi bacterium]|nr:DUF2339 domain-containing protein [Chlorobiota bacterium]
MSEKNYQSEILLLTEKISFLENRISAIEKRLEKNKTPLLTEKSLTKSPEEVDFSLPYSLKKSTLEANIGMYGLAWFGNIVLLLAGIFLHLFIQSKGQSLLAAGVGYIFALTMVFLAKKIQKSLIYLSKIFRLFAKLFLFYVTVELHFFTNNPFITNKYFSLFLLSLFVIYQIYKSVKKESEENALLGLFYIIIIGVLSNKTHIILPLLTLTAIGSLYFLFRFGWTKILIYSIILSYSGFILWAVGNPIMNHPAAGVTKNQFSEFYLSATAGIFSLVFFAKQKELLKKNVILSSLILNGLGFSVLIILWSLLFFKDNFQIIFASISVFCILYSIILKKYSQWHYSSALYAVYGFVAMSVSFYGIFKIPMVFLTLTIQSLLVLSMSLWFKSKIIVVLNTILFLILCIAYFGYNEHISVINFSFPLVAGISARIINWQKERLTLETQFIRNIYLFVLFFSFLYALYKGLTGYVTISWSIAALIYFVLSIILKNVKYRYMAIGTIGTASIYLFFVDLVNINVIYRIATFLVLALISIGISVYYVKKSSDKNKETEK